MPIISFAALFECSPNAYMLLDRELRYVAANAAYCREVHVDREDLIGRPLLDMFPNDPADPNNEAARRLRESFERVLATGQPDVIPVIAYSVPRVRDNRHELEERLWSATHTPIHDEAGQVAYILQHTTDVTALNQPANAGAVVDVPPQVGADVLRRAQEVQATNLTLEVEHQNLSRLFHQSPGFMAFLAGPDHVFEIANTAYSQLVGHREIVGRPLREAIPEMADQGYIEILHRVYTTGEAFAGRGMRVLLQQHPGSPLSEVFLDFSYQPISNARGAILGVLVHGYDITAQKRQEVEYAKLLDRERAARAAAEEAESRQRFLAESIPQQVWTATPAGELDSFNGRGLDYFGGSLAELAVDPWNHVVHPDDREAALERWRHSLGTGEEYEAILRLRRADGMYRWHLRRAVALRGPDGRVVKWFGTNTDMDELTRTRNELRARAEFDQQLIGIVSHDLRNPLNAIGMATALLLKYGQLNEQHVKIVSRIMSSSDRAVRLIRDFLDFTQTRVSGRIPVVRAEANIREIARQVFEEVHLTQPHRQVMIEHEGEETGIWDGDRLAQLVGNLVSNAFQHSFETGVVRLSTIGGPDEVVIEVHNQGPPIPPDALDRLFEPFERGDDVRPHSGRSVGLGLYISRQIVEAHGGRIEVESSADSGTSFTVRLPRVVADSPAEDSERTSAASAG